MKAVDDTLQDIYTRWFDKTNKIIEERKEQKRRAATSGSGTSHKWVLGACWSKKVAYRKLCSFEDVSQDLRQGCGVDKVQRSYHNAEAKD